MNRAVVLLVALAAATASAQPDAQPEEADFIVGDDAPAGGFDPGTCLVATPAATPAATGAPPVTWNGFDIEGVLRDRMPTVRTLFEPTMNRHRALTDSARDDIRRISGAFGYHLVDLGTKETPTGTHAVIQLASLPMVRRVDVDVKQGWFDTLLEDEIRRRMRTRIGSYLPWTPNDRACEIYEETLRIEEFLRDEGYFEGRVRIKQVPDAKRGVTLEVKVTLRDEYTTGVINIAPREPNNISDEEITKLFRHSGNCILNVCFGNARFKRSTHQADIQKVIDLFHTRGYPAVRVRTDFDPQTSFDRDKKTVDFVVTIDQRRHLSVVFEGQTSAVAESELEQQLTFNQAASSDDVEASESAKALATFLQGRGFFDARVTWSRERFERFDRIVFRIEQGKTRQVRAIQFVGNRALDDATLRGAIGTREVRLSSRLFGARSAATSVQLANDVDAIVETYRRAGYREARARVSAATDLAGLDRAALAAALVLVDSGAGLYVRYTIDEGQPTLLTQIELALGARGDAIDTQEQRDLCRALLGDLAAFFEEPQIATQAIDTRCVAAVSNLKFRESVALDMRDRLRERLYSYGRPRARVAYDAKVLGTHHVAVRYALSDIQTLKVGKIVVRGNFKTQTSVILAELRGPKNEAQFTEGGPLTKDALAESARRLRNTGLFDAVNVAMPDLDNTSEGSVNAVVEVAERYDLLVQLELETGYSTFNGVFLRLAPSFKNLFGRGISLDLAGTIGLKAAETVSAGEVKLRQLSAEATLRVPQWLTRQWLPDLIAPQVELQGFHRRQDTPRFGEITTDGVTLALSRTWQRPRLGNRSAYARTVGVHYDFRLRERLVDVLRPIGADDDQTQVPIKTRTGTGGITFEWEQRTDRNGTLSPLAPQAGFRLEGQVSYAFRGPLIFGGDFTFIKVSAAASKYVPIGDNLVIRGDVRYDQGFPLGGAVLLPEVERFFAGGDSTVRGYEDDRLATEVIRVGVPPFDNAEQIRILPSGGNIRVMSSLDAQLRIWRVLAAAAFVDAGMIANQWGNVTEDDIRPSIGIALIRIVTPFGTGALERAMPLNPHLGDNPRGRWHLSFAARAQF